MNRVPVVSSNLLSVGYHEPTATLEVEFRSHTVYQYAFVPPEVHQGLMAAASYGRYLHARVKKAGYAYRRVPDIPQDTKKLLDPREEGDCGLSDDHDRKYREAFDNGTLAQFTGLDTPEKIAAVLAIMPKGKPLKIRGSRATKKKMSKK